MKNLHGEDIMSYFWTVQSKEVVDIINSKGEYYPDFAYHNARDYRIVLKSFNNINKTNYKGLVFGFAKRGEEGCFGNVRELYEYLLQNPDVTLAFPFWNEEYVILQLKVEENFNQIPIDFNDFNQITFPICGKEALRNIIASIEQGVYNDKCMLPSFTQVHFPYIKKENVINIYGNFDKKHSDDTGEVNIFPICHTKK